MDTTCTIKANYSKRGSYHCFRIGEIETASKNKQKAKDEFTDLIELLATNAKTNRYYMASDKTTIFTLRWQGETWAYDIVGTGPNFRTVPCSCIMPNTLTEHEAFEAMKKHADSY